MKVEMEAGVAPVVPAVDQVDLGRSLRGMDKLIWMIQRYALFNTLSSLATRPNP